MFLRCCVYLTGLLCTWMVMPGLCENVCPPVAELHSTQKMVADLSQTNYTSFTWLRSISKTGPLKCEIEKETCISINDNFNGNVTSNGTASDMVIGEVTNSDSGMWQLLDGLSSERFNVCRLVTTKKPHCTINSDDDAHNVDLGDELTLKINITGYYCSETAAFNLTTGDVSQILAQNHTLEDNNDKDKYANKTIDILLTRFGDVTLDFSCHDSTWKIACDGVKKIIKSMPQCNISSDKNTDELDLGGDLTLTAYIRGYFCPKAAIFTLTTGDVQQMSQNYSVDNVTNIDINTTFNMTVSHFGNVTLNYTCDGDTWVLACGGVKELVGKMPQCNISSDKNTDELDLGGKLTLTAHTRGYYCRKAAIFTLTTGDGQQMSQNYSVGNVTNTDINATFSMTVSHFGNVTLKYTCDGDTSVLACGGVTKLVGTMPQCNISSDKNTDELDLGDELTLTAHTRGYYCPKAAIFTLTTGDGQHMSQNYSAHNVTNTDINTTFNMTLSHFGNVTLKYTCDGDTWLLACGGVTKLVGPMPQCNISSDKNTNELDLGDELTLTAYIRGYYCPKAAVFALTTGGVQHMSQNYSVDNVTNTDINTTFNMTLSHFGKVTLKYTCDGDTWVLACGGVKELVGRFTATSAVTHSIYESDDKKTVSTPEPLEESPIPMIVGSIVGVVLAIVLIVVIVRENCWKCKKTR